MSGGEKSAAIHLPLFAAANALYSSSKPTARGLSRWMRRSPGSMTRSSRSCWG